MRDGSFEAALPTYPEQEYFAHWPQFFDNLNREGRFTARNETIVAVWFGQISPGPLSPFPGHFRSTAVTDFSVSAAYRVTMPERARANLCSKWSALVPEKWDMCPIFAAAVN